MSNERIIQVKAKPNSHTNKVTELEDGTFIVHLKATPVDGKANKELIATLATHFGLRKANISIKTGNSARLKRVILQSEP